MSDIHLMNRKACRTCQFFLIIVVVLLGLVAGCMSSTIPSGNTNEPKLINVSKIQPVITITDSAGQHFSFDHPAQRIVILNAGAAELLIDIGASDQIVGVADFVMTKERPYIASRLPNVTLVGAFTTPDIETILTLKPDVVISYANSKPQNLNQMLEANITVIQLTCYRPTELAGNARTLGTLTGQIEGAERYAQFIERKLALVEERIGNISAGERPRTYFEYVNEYSVFTPESSGGHLLSIAHGDNVGKNLIGQQVLVNREWVLEQDPDVIIKEVPAASGSYSLVRDQVIGRQGFNSLKAVKGNRVYCISPELVSTPRSVIGSIYIAKALYPDRFTDVDPEKIRQEYARNFLPGSEKAELFYPLQTSNP